MKTTDSLTAGASDMLRWQFRQDDRRLTCGVSKSNGSSFSVITLPHWDVRKITVETFRSQTLALQRHASIAERLRSSGWAIDSYTR